MLSSIADTWISDFSKWHEPKLPTDALVFQLGPEAFSGFLNLRRVQQTLGIPGWSASTSAKVWCLNSASRRNLKDRFHIPRIVRELNERTANLQWMNEFCTPEEFPKLALQSNPPKKDRKVTYHHILVGFYCFYFSILTWGHCPAKLSIPGWSQARCAAFANSSAPLAAFAKAWLRRRQAWTSWMKGNPDGDQ